jgi:glycylpeptide N-tetradecanoyltransferase
MKKSQFWSSQPVGLCDRDTMPGPIQSSLQREKIRTEPYECPPGLHIITFDHKEDIHIDRVHRFLSAHYVEDDSGNIRLLYEPDFLRWFLQQGEDDWAVGLERGEDKELVGFISAVKRNVVLMGKDRNVAEVNLLCVHKDYRKELALAPLLIKEITRRVNLYGIFNAIYTSGSLLPQRPFHTARYFHKYLDLDRANEFGFCAYPDVSIAKLHWEFKFKKSSLQDGEYMYLLRRAKEEDFPTIVEMMNNRSELIVKELFSVEKLKTMECCRQIQLYVVEKVDKVSKERKLCGFMSTFDQDILSVRDGKRLKLTYMHYFCGDVSTALNALLYNLQKQGRDVFSIITIGQGIEVIKEMNMLPGSGFLHYYMYNYRLPVLGSSNVSYLVF